LSLLRALNSTIGKKYVMAITGLLLCGFLVFHLAGNVLMFVGPEAYNAYAHGLHSTEPLLYVAETALAILFLAHVYLAISTALENTAARRHGYAEKNSKMDVGFRPDTWMFWSGAVVLGFLIVHVVDFTVEGREALPPPLRVEDAYTARVTTPDGDPLSAGALGTMDRDELEAVVEHNHLHVEPAAHADVDDLRRAVGDAIGDDGEAEREPFDKAIILLANPITATVYAIGSVFLIFHLVHGFRSACQSLGLNHPAWNRCLRWFSVFFGIVVGAGFLAFPILGYLGLLH
jgi:succinate dehydrogenase / fumarate reductase, cytochrome b subunit